MPRALTMLVGLCVSIASGGCQLIADIERLPPRNELACDDAGPPVTDGGPEMAKVMRSDGTCFWIDKTEVTRGQYDSFLRSNPGLRADGVCNWNLSYEPPDSGAPDGGCVPSPPGPGAEADTLPMVCVDFCDALAFCEWAGKSLCRGDHNATSKADSNDWLRACAGPDSNTFPYGKVRDSNRCNGNDNPVTGCLSNPSCGAVTAAALMGCSTEDGVVHLSGNVAEWVNACTGTSGPNDSCEQRGGSYGSSLGQLQCDEPILQPRVNISPTIGFRCCVSDS